MKTSSANPPLVVILGPTVVGKSEIAIRIAEVVGGEIISADSRLFYRGMDIGTAKPTLADRRRVPHHLIDVADPDETWSLTIFQEAVARTISDISNRGHLPILVGGTGQYIDGVIHGWVPPSAPPTPKLRLFLEELARERGKGWLHVQLGKQDPEAASVIDPRNLRRTIRALEVIITTGKRFSSQRVKDGNRYDHLLVGLTCTRSELYARIDERIETMFSNGFLNEVGRLIETGWSPDLPSMSAIGYREGVLVLQGKISIEEAKIRMRKTTRVFVRRQANWFKSEDETIHWFAVSPDPAEKIIELIRSLFPQFEI